MISFLKNLFNFKTYSKKKITKNFFSLYTSEGTQILTQLLFAPLMLYFWGVRDFGIWLFLISIPNIFLIFNINFQAAAVQEITILNSQKKYLQSNKIFQNSILFSFVNIFVITLLIAIAFIFNFLDLSILDEFSNLELKLILFFIILSIYLNMLQGIFQTGINSIGKLYINYNISSYTDLVSKFLIAISGYYFESLIYPAIIYFTTSLLRFVLYCYYFLLNNRHLKISIKERSLKIFLKLAKLSIGFTLDVVNFLIRHSLIIFIIGIFLEPHIIGYVVTVKTLFYFFPARFFDKLRDISLYEFASLFGENKMSFIKDNIIKFNILILLLLSLFISLSYSIGPFIYNTWTDNKYELSMFFLTIVLFDVFFFILRNSIVAFYMSVNRYIFLGTSDFLITCLITSLFYFSLLKDNSFNEAFIFVVIGSFVSLLVTIVYHLYNFKNLKKKI